MRLRPLLVFFFSRFQSPSRFILLRFIHLISPSHNPLQCPTFNPTTTPAGANGPKNTSTTRKPSASATASSALVKVPPPRSSPYHPQLSPLPGGWSPSTPSPSLDNFIPASLSAEIDQAFSNVSHTLKSAGGEGWTQVYKIVTYSTDIPAQHERIVENLRKWMPGHRAVWTEVGVKMLGVEEMRFEVEVEAWDGEGMAE